MNILDENLDKIRKEYEGIFESVFNIASDCGLNIHLIGAQCRDAWLSHLNLPLRKTLDIDYIVGIDSMIRWEDFITSLNIKGGFVQDKNQPYRFYKDDKTIDVIPYFVFSDTREISFENSQVIISIEGFKTVVQGGSVSRGGFNLVSVASLCILKLLSFSAKRYERAKDLEDFYALVENFTRIYPDIVFEEKYLDLLVQSGDVEKSGAMILGIEMRKVIESNKFLEQKIPDIITSLLKGMSEEDIRNLDQDYLTAKDAARLNLTLSLLNGYNSY